MRKDFRVCLVKAYLLWSLTFLVLKGVSSADEPKCEISCRVGDGPKDEETVDPDSIIPSHCSIKNGRNISQNMTWKEVNDKITHKPGLQCLVLKSGNSVKRIFFASPLTVQRWGSPAYLHANQMNRDDVKCEFKGRPRPQITWYKDGSNLKTFNHTEVEKLQDSGIFEVTTTLHVPGREEFAGIYRCFGNNSLSSGSPGIYITRSGPEEISANAFSNITLSCLVAKNAAKLDDLRKTWTFKNQSYQLKTGGKYRIPALEPISSCKRAFKLEIIKVTADDEGVYSCHQSCKQSDGDPCKSSAQLELKVYSPPPKVYSSPTTRTVSNSTRVGDNTTSEAAEATTVFTTEATTVSTTEATTVSTTEATTVSTTDAPDVLQSVQGYLEERMLIEKLFISYSSKDFSWVTENLISPLEKHAIPYSIHSRDFELGRPIVQNMADSVYNSRQVLIVLSNNYLASNFCREELHMALQRKADTGDSSLILVTIDKLKKKQLPRALTEKNLLDFEKHQKKQDWEKKLVNALHVTENITYV
ncbi:Toll-like receptor 6 [Acropora cervicornis]|uniref:Toll-like receptor 6 n=1 Tax=Acropora cervicornis TaxID=6130 RepID=A0AAD9V4X3_ACRCE|nr:Toll-like receptor 6 [Acropora cervicornis]